MNLVYLGHRLTFVPPVIEIHDRSGRRIEGISTTTLDPKVRRLLRNTRILPALLFSMMEDVIPQDGMPEVHLSRDCTYDGARDRLVKTAIHWNRKRIRPIFVPRPKPVDMVEAFGRQGASTLFWGVDVCVFFSKKTQMCNLRMSIGQNPPTTFPIGSDVTLAIPLIALFLRDRTDAGRCCYGSSSRKGEP